MYKPNSLIYNEFKVLSLSADLQVIKTKKAIISKQKSYLT